MLQRQYMDLSWKAVLNPGGANDFFEQGMPGAIDVRTNRFSPTNAWWLSELSRLVYRRGEEEGGVMPNGPGRRDFLARVGLEERAFFNAGGVQAAFITRTRDNLPPVGILVFRGTTGTWRNWQSNLSVWSSQWPRGGRVHSGFKKQFMGLWPTIVETVTAWTAPLLYTGHSLGAALATLAAGMHRPHALYTFGSPRVGDSDFADTLKDVCIYRLCNAGDIVTFLPPSRGPLRFCHVGEPMIYRKAPSPPPAFSIAQDRDIATPALGIPHPPKFLVDHAPANYISWPGPEIAT
ncbi:MAG: lipase family protein [Pseudomonadota bacterium]